MKNLRSTTVPEEASRSSLGMNSSTGLENESIAVFTRIWLDHEAPAATYSSPPMAKTNTPCTRVSVYRVLVQRNQQASTLSTQAKPGTGTTGCQRRLNTALLPHGARAARLPLPPEHGKPLLYARDLVCGGAEFCVEHCLRRHYSWQRLVASSLVGATLMRSKLCEDVRIRM